jgi:hypothetical protein
MVIPEFRVELDPAFTKPICNATADILSKSVSGRAAGDDLHLPNGAAKPPRPVGIADYGVTGRCRFT